MLKYAAQSKNMKNSTGAGLELAKIVIRQALKQGSYLSLLLVYPYPDKSRFTDKSWINRG